MLNLKISYHIKQTSLRSGRGPRPNRYLWVLTGPRSFRVLCSNTIGDVITVNVTTVVAQRG
jgi:hypothetical protein